MKTQRLRFRYSVREEALHIRQRELVQAWESAAKAAGLALSYSEGKRPGPQISFASPLPADITSDCEIADIFLDEPVQPADALVRIKPHLPSGIAALSAEEVGVNAESAHASVRWAEYEVDVPANALDESDARERIECLLTQTALPSQYRREAKVREYDLRPLVLDIRLVLATADTFTLSMILRAEQEKSARADQVILALHLPKPLRVHRKRLGLSDVPTVIEAYRRAGERED